MLRKEDFALFHHIIWYNIWEESRHMDEWTDFQTLTSSELLQYKKSILVNYAYDRKNWLPTTCCVMFDVGAFVLHQMTGVGECISDLNCWDLTWSLQKKKDRSSRQNLTCSAIELNRNGTDLGNDQNEPLLSLLQPVQKADAKESNDNIYPAPLLTYRSTTHTTGDNVRLLEVKSARFFLSCHYWGVVCQFFQNLPKPNIVNRDDALNSMQIGDRFYCKRILTMTFITLKS